MTGLAPDARYPPIGYADVTLVAARSDSAASGRIHSRPGAPWPRGCGYQLQQVVDQPGVGVEHLSARPGMGRGVAQQQPLGHQLVHRDPAVKRR